MRGIAALVPVKYKLKHMYPVARSWVATITPKKHENNDFGEGRRLNEKTDPIVAFSRPPQLPPVFGPLVALSLFEMWSSHDGDDD
ncbi:uncharacterized protein LOC112537570 [Ricinus communis]|uniref:uncharacterized protein LOC112537570 n=1 Tax=Ricinus communis TaxID=3988 RepID=UPI000D6860E8|nr:uncharacterized protein LOC112537570 [Ricinus communis]|eukprot:XP_025015875.1 uncharacterized protein LOC112537570 [Ricinus communis]